MNWVSRDPLACMKLTLFAVLLILASAPRVRAQETVRSAANEQIKIKAVPHLFSWINKQKDYRILSGDSVSITAPNETDLFNDPATGGAACIARILSCTSYEAFVMTAKATPDFN